MKYLLILLFFSISCTQKITKNDIKSIRHGTSEAQVHKDLGEPTEWYKKKSNPNYLAYLYRDGDLSCAVEFSSGYVFNTNCVETR